MSHLRLPSSFRKFSPMTTISRLHTALPVLALLLALPGLPPAALPQENLRTQLFSGADSLLSRAKEHKAEILAPSNFKKGMGYYNEASEAFKKGSKLETIRAKVLNASDYLAKALDIAVAGEAAFTSALAARTDANSAGAATQQPELWRQAEERFARATSEFEDGETASAAKYGTEATDLFRTAELEAIKANYLSPARILIDKATQTGVDETAPATLARARELVAKTEQILKGNRYDTDEARTLAQEARYEADHALAIHEAITKMKQDESNYEPTLLRIEGEVARISGALGLKARFDRGFGPPADEAVAAVKKRSARIDSLTDALEHVSADVNARDVESENLKAQIASMEQRVGALTDNEKDLQASLATHRSQESTIREVERMFTPDEGHVLRDGSRVIVRLYGLSFPVGSNNIEPQYYPLLTKVQEAIRKFPKAVVTIEGHTDAAGTDEVNQKLSEGRALAVAEYLMANMGVQTAVNSQGFGESRPLASNETSEGRAKNRRIDVVVTPAW